MLESVFGFLGELAVSAVSYIPSVIFLVILYFITSYAIKFARLIAQGIRVGRIEVSGFEPEWAMPAFSVSS